jgi:hypothetical protein
MTTRSALHKLAVLTAAVAALVASTPRRAAAHTGVQSYLYLDVTPDRLAGRVEMPYGDLRQVFGLTLQGADTTVLDELRSQQARLAEYVAGHLSIGAGGRTWAYEVTGLDLLVAEGGYGVVRFTVQVPVAEVPRVLEVRFDPFFDEIPKRDALLLIANDWQGGVIENGEEALVGFDPGVRTRTIDLGQPSQWRNFAASLWMGVDHIRTGPDHILFVLALLLPSVLVFAAGGWRPVATFAGSLWRILGIVTMFTLAHSITFLLAGLDLLPLPSPRVVESIIAISIAATALHNLRPIAVNREWSIAFVFGLFHGMGFASLVGALDVSQATRLVSLLGRNVGIEVGQAVVVLLVFPALFVLRRTTWYRPSFIAASVALAAISVGWMIERVFTMDLNVGGVVAPLIAFPRALVLVALAVTVSAAIYRYEHRAGRLLPTADTGR